MQSWFVVLQPNGVVEAVQNGAPSTWVGHELASLADVPEDVRALARDLVARAPRLGCLQRAVVHTREGTIELVLVEAVPLRRAYVPINDLIVRLLDVFASQARTSAVQLSVRQVGAAPPVFWIDGEKITWALATLVGNALRYAQGSTKARVEVVFSWSAESEELVAVVSDNGPGMTEQRASWLFERDPSTGNAAGLALLMVRDVVAAHRGHIRVETSPGKGSSFIVRLPRVTPP